MQAKTAIMVMVKAYGYGLGPVGLSKFLEEQGVGCLGVANILEGVEIRKSGVKLPIAIMKPQLESFDLAIKHNLTPVIFSLRALRTYVNVVKALPLTNYTIHLKLDTGMHRLGFVLDELDEVISTIKLHPTIKIESVFSQFSSSGNVKDDDFSLQQLQLFEKMSEKIISSFNYKINKHIANSNAIIRFPGAHFDMVRLGIGLLGFVEDKTINDKLKNVVALKTKIAQIHYLKAGETVGYGRTTIVTKPSKIATIPIGYADGFSRQLGNGNWSFTVNDKLAPTIGNICMDITMIDVTEIDCSEEDVALLFNTKESIFSLSKVLKTIPYEVFTTISPRVKRDFI